MMMMSIENSWAAIDGQVFHTSGQTSVMWWKHLSIYLYSSLKVYILNNLCSNIDNSKVELKKRKRFLFSTNNYEVLVINNLRKLVFSSLTLSFFVSSLCHLSFSFFFFLSIYLPFSSSWFLFLLIFSFFLPSFFPFFHTFCLFLIFFYSFSCPGYDTKQSDGEVPVMLELWGIWKTLSLLSLPGPLWPCVVAPGRALSMG